MTERRKIRWLIAHFPAYLFIRTAEAFSAELEKMRPGEFEIEILTMKDYVNKYNKLHEFLIAPPGVEGLEDGPAGGAARWEKAVSKWPKMFAALGDGEFELSQTPIGLIGTHLYRNFSAIDLPFLFKDHDHVTDVLDGQIGDSLCNQLAKETPIRGLAFTYSGGYRVIGSKQKIKNLTELSATKLLTHSIHSSKLFKGIGAKTFGKQYSTDLDLADVAEDPNAAIETTYLRFTGTHVYKTEHSMFTTSILTGNKFWDSLTEDQQKAFQIAAKNTAKLEREWSIEDALKYEKDATSKGIEIVNITEEDRAQLQKASAIVYDTLNDRDIDTELVQAIIDAGNSTKH